MVALIFFGISVASAGAATSVAGSRSTRPSKMCMLAAYGVAPDVIIGSNPVDKAYDRPASMVPLPSLLPAVPSAVEEGPPHAESPAVMAAAAPMALV